ncbi:MAG: Cupredoxin family domain protein [Candidatus Woesebacteria bacterium GW2011_GWA1_39_21]|uniref:Cupredoxin family domain protein n=1 Tax=Candidatus Woesebacteria bacterium GW2011_GWA1_39_21 TaxID=1618550 RepID=A0A0G0QL98_9BACT|nr:MAG: Cupredoxin family domain protein [Candidatus Woesebacteria bacterium GW2011_GWA1_39_21]
MILSKIIVTSFGLILIGFIYWFFFGKKSSTAEVLDGQGEIKVTVEGGYKPEVIKLKKGIKTTLILKRTDTNPCLEDFIIPDLKIKRYLPMNKEIKVSIKVDRVGIWDFHCGMNMYHGKLIVE